MAYVINMNGRMDIPSRLPAWHAVSDYPQLIGNFIGNLSTKELGLEEILDNSVVSDDARSFERFVIDEIKLLGADVDNRTLVYDVTGSVFFKTESGDSLPYGLPRPLRVLGNTFADANNTVRGDIGLTRDRVPVYVDRDGREFPVALLDKVWFVSKRRYDFDIDDIVSSVEKIVVEEFVAGSDGRAYFCKGTVFYTDESGLKKGKLFEKDIPASVLILDLNYSSSLCDVNQVGPEVDLDTLVDATGGAVDTEGTTLTPRAAVRRARSRARKTLSAIRQNISSVTFNDILNSVCLASVILIPAMFSFALYHHPLGKTNKEGKAWQSATESMGRGDYYSAINYAKKAHNAMGSFDRFGYWILPGSSPYLQLRAHRDFWLKSRVVPRDSRLAAADAEVPGKEARVNVGGSMAGTSESKVAEGSAEQRAKSSSGKKPGVAGRETRRSYAVDVLPFRSGDPLGEQYGDMIKSQYDLLASQGRDYSGSLFATYEVGNDKKVRSFVVDRIKSDRNALGFGDGLREELIKGSVTVRGDSGIYRVKFNLGGK